MNSSIIRTLVFLLISTNISFSQTQVNISNQGFVHNSFTFFIKNISEDTISIINPSLLFKYNARIKCFAVDQKYYSYDSNVVSFEYPFIKYSIKDFVADGNESDFEMSSNVHFILPDESYGLCLIPKGIKRRILKESNIKFSLHYENHGVIRKFNYPR